MFFLYNNDFSELSIKTATQLEFIKQTPFFPYTLEQEKNAVENNKQINLIFLNFILDESSKTFTKRIG